MVSSVEMNEPTVKDNVPLVTPEDLPPPEEKTSAYKKAKSIFLKLKPVVNYGNAIRNASSEKITEIHEIKSQIASLSDLVEKERENNPEASEESVSSTETSLMSHELDLKAKQSSRIKIFYKKSFNILVDPEHTKPTKCFALAMIPTSTLALSWGMVHGLPLAGFAAGSSYVYSKVTSQERDFVLPRPLGPITKWIFCDIQ